MYIVSEKDASNIDIEIGLFVKSMLCLKAKERVEAASDCRRREKNKKTSSQ